ncbi:X box binding protein 1 [Calliopsis andreniformis]|uniref:X box binding protein 1 n=1 Tax=Calliopsis andreniformis TaxID=337506 RepID=UPI003FCE3A45
MSVLKSVIITLPKGLTKAPGVISASELGKPKFNFTTSILADKPKMDSKKIAKHEEMQDESALFKTDVCVRGKKRRLDHLTWEEKLQRKKLKNRVAAQTSRDRKKAKLDELEETVRALREQNELLTQECSMLRSQNELLVTETKRLRKEKDSKNEELVCSMCQSRVGCAVSSLGSTVSPTHPLQQGGTTQLAPSLTLTPGAAILLKILTIYLLLKNCLVTSKETITSNDLKNLQRAFCERLPQKWKQILIEQMNKCQSRKIPLRNVTIQKEWWGRHQKMWKPVEPLEA